MTRPPKMAEKMVHLFKPPGPVVIDIVSPNVNPGGDTGALKNCFQGAGILKSFFIPGALPDTDHDRAPPVFFQQPGIVQAGEIGDG